MVTTQRHLDRDRGPGKGKSCLNLPTCVESCVYSRKESARDSEPPGTRRIAGPDSERLILGLGSKARLERSALEYVQLICLTVWCEQRCMHVCKRVAGGGAGLFSHSGRQFRTRGEDAVEIRLSCEVILRLLWCASPFSGKHCFLLPLLVLEMSVKDQTYEYLLTENHEDISPIC